MAGGETDDWADSSGGAAARRTLTDRASISGAATSGAAAACGALSACSGAAADALAAIKVFLALFGRAFGGCRCHTRAVTRMSSFSANGAIRHQLRGSATYRSCELTSSGNRLLSMTGLVVSQVSTPGGNT